MQTYLNLDISAEMEPRRVEISMGNDSPTPLGWFGNWKEINEFIDQLRDAAQTAFGPDYSDPKYDI